MLSPYAAILRTPGVRRFVTGRLLAQLGGSMFGVSVVTMVALRRGSFSTAGMVSAAGLVVLAFAGPVLGMLIDRHGQKRIATPATMWAGTWLALTILASWRMLPVWTLFVGYALTCVVPNFGTMSRARWQHILGDGTDELHTAMSLEQVLDEMTFILGPVVGVGLATAVAPEAGLIAAGLCYGTGSVLFLSSRWTEPPVTPHEDRPVGSAVRRPGVLTVTAVMFMVGVIFGTNEVTIIAVAKQAGNEGAAGPILALFAVGSAGMGLVYGLLRLRMSLAMQLVLGALGMTVLEAPVLLTDSLVALGPLLMVAGIATSPTLIVGLSLAQRLVPRAQINEGMTIVLTGLLVGIAAGSAVSGRVIEGADSAGRGFAVAVAAGTTAFLIALVGLRSLTRHSGEVRSEGHGLT